MPTRGDDADPAAPLAVDLLERLLQCPVTGRRLRLLSPERLAAVNARVEGSGLVHVGGGPVERPLEGGLATEAEALVYPLHQGVALMLPELAIPLTAAGARQAAAAPGSGYAAGVRAFYEEVGWRRREGEVFEDAARFEDLRPVARDYVRRCHLRVRRYLPPRGRYLLDAASGPIQYPEYLTYDEGFDVRVCLDLSLRALLEARRRLPPGRGLFVLGDVTRLPLRAGMFDGVVSLHTLYHVPAERQADALAELQRVLSPGGRGAVVYSWGPRAPLMRAARLPQRLARAPLRLLGAPLRWLRRPPPAPATSGEPELYFHPLSYAELRATRPFRGVRLAVWRSVDVPFTRAYAHGRLGGRHLLRAVFALEERFPRACGRLGAYPIFLLEGAPGPDAGEA